MRELFAGDGEVAMFYLPDPASLKQRADTLVREIVEPVTMACRSQR
ncbi:MAG: hypothetical protein OXC93_01965 [Rhodospirillaceae bacterium]|nr:hypothetical protein [Rhodospirillaceae bacterium]